MADARLIHLLSKLKKHYFTHTKAAEYYDKMHMRVVYPSVVITALSSIASFLSTSNAIDNNAGNGLALTVGILSIVSTMLQSISAVNSFNSKRDSFMVAADEYNKLITQIEFEINMPNEEVNDFFNKMEIETLKIQNKCKSIVPTWIIEKHKNSTYYKTSFTNI